MVQPAPTEAVRSAQACSVISLSRTVEKTTSARDGGFPQQIFVPPPRGTTAKPASLTSRSACASFDSLLGTRTSFGGTSATTSGALAACTFLSPMNDTSLWRNE